MTCCSDPFDPRVVLADMEPPAPCRIYGTKDLAVFSLVDWEDYQHLVQWKWSPKWSRGDKKFYLRRSVQELHGKDQQCLDTGRRLRNRTQRTLFLHAAVLLRAGILPPTPAHTMVDHRDGDGMNCQRRNLRWATPAQNRTNINGDLKREEWA